MSHPHPPRPRRAHLRASVFSPAGPISAAVRAALFISLAASPLILAAPPAHAQAQPVARYGVNIPAGPLGQALIAFANAVGVELSMDTGQLSGKNSQGLQGQYTVQAGFAALLSGHGFEAVRTANGSYALARIPDPAQGVLLPVVTVQGDPDADPALTEGTGSYTTRAMSTATGLALSPRETPQSVSIVTRQQIDDRNIKSLAEALRTTTGMAESAYDTERSSFSYRGFSVENYLYDGVPTTFSSPYAAGESDLDSVIYDRIEIVRGATGLMTGAGNPSAAINLVRKRALSDKVEGEITASAGSWDNYRTTIDIATPFNKEATVRGRFVAAGQMGNSFLDNHEKKKGVLFGTVEADLTDRTLLRAGADYQVNRPKASTWGGALGTGWFSNGEAIDWPRSFNGAPKWSQWNSPRTALPPHAAAHRQVSQSAGKGVCRKQVEGIPRQGGIQFCAVRSHQVEVRVACLDVPARQHLARQLDLEPVALRAIHRAIRLRRRTRDEIVQVGLRDVVLLCVKDRQRGVQAVVEERALDARLVILPSHGVQVGAAAVLVVLRLEDIRIACVQGHVAGHVQHDPGVGRDDVERARQAVVPTCVAGAHDDLQRIRERKPAGRIQADLPRAAAQLGLPFPHCGSG